MLGSVVTKTRRVFLGNRGSVRIISQTPNSIELERDNFHAKAWVDDNGDYQVWLDSRELIKDYMLLDEDLTRQVIAYWKDYNRRYIEGHRPPWTEDIRKFVEPVSRVSAGRKTTHPTRGSWSLGEHEWGNTYNLDYSFWLGDIFEYVHFYTGDGDEGLVVRWHEGGDARGNYSEPEVWRGDAQGFMQDQYEGDPATGEAFNRWNDLFNNGFMEALESLGAFDDPGNIEEDSIIANALMLEPGNLPEAAKAKILRNPEAYPVEIAAAAGYEPKP